MSEDVRVVDDINADLPLKDLISKMQEVYNDTARKRQALHKKVTDAIDNMKIDANGDAEVLEAQIKLIDQSDKIMNSTEKAFLSRVQVLLKQKENEEQNKIFSALAAQVLKSSKTPNYVPTKNAEVNEGSMDRIHKALASLDPIEYNSGELKTDSKDYS
jgi:hypothetical protein